MLGRNVIPVYEYTEDKEAAEILRKAFDVRNITLDIVCGVPGYKEAALEVKNWLYDVVRQKVYEVVA